jgi:hypothetical protein
MYSWKRATAYSPPPNVMMRFASICLKPLTPREEKKTVHLQVFMDTWKKQHPPKGKVSFNKRKEQKQKYFFVID